MNDVCLLREMIRLALTEAVLSVKAPTNPQEAKAFLELVQWASTRMSVPKGDVDVAVEKAETGDWSDAMDLLRTFYVMKGVRNPGDRKSS